MPIIRARIGKAEEVEEDAKEGRMSKFLRSFFPHCTCNIWQHQEMVVTILSSVNICPQSFFKATWPFDFQRLPWILSFPENLVNLRKSLNMSSVIIIFFLVKDQRSCLVSPGKMYGLSFLKSKPIILFDEFNYLCDLS